MSKDRRSGKQFMVFHQGVEFGPETYRNAMEYVNKKRDHVKVIHLVKIRPKKSPIRVADFFAGRRT